MGVLLEINHNWASWDIKTAGNQTNPRGGHRFGPPSGTRSRGAPKAISRRPGKPSSPTPESNEIPRPAPEKRLPYPRDLEPEVTNPVQLSIANAHTTEIYVEFV